MSVERPSWAAPLAELRRLHTELRRTAPYRDDGLIPRPAAAADRLLATEQRLGLQLPPSYRAFLQRHDGWSRFYDGVHLLSCEELGQQQHLHAAELLLCGSLRGHSSEGTRLLPFGIDSQMCSIFAFDVNCASAEKPVIAWVGELGVRVSNFTQFVELLVQFSAAELHSSSHTSAVNLPRDAAASAA